ncbi:translational GTPase TypA, partial [Candidatus Riflebacteria bacterium]
IIAHVDHGKTTLVDAMFKQSGVFREGSNIDERIMDNIDLERERGITISAKNCSVQWKGVKINILDTPGHSDFGGEVERALSMTDGAILLVDASEGPLPQTRFVLKKALESNIKVIVVINKIDRKDARAEETLDEIYDLFIELDASDEQFNFHYLYAIGREGIVKKTLAEECDNLHLLFDTIIDRLPAPEFTAEEPLQMLVSDLGYSDFLGRLAIGKINNGSVSCKDSTVFIDKKQKSHPFKIKKLQLYKGMKLVDTENAAAGDIVVISGMEDIEIGDTICNKDHPKPLPRITVDEPTISMEFTINTSPLSGFEGKIVQSTKIRERLLKETLMNVAVKFEATLDRDRFIVKGRGEFQMAILIETMRREGFELSVGRPEVIYKRINEKVHEPIEKLFIECEEKFLGIVTEKLSKRKGRLFSLNNSGKGRVRASFSIPSRSLIGYRDEFLTDTRGTGILCPTFVGYEEYRGEYSSRSTGSIVADRAGKAAGFALSNLEPRGRLFITPGSPVYEGMLIGEHNKNRDINVNATKGKKLTNMRAAGKDDAITHTSVQPMTLEKAIIFIRDDEMVEVTPQSIRMHKRVFGAQERHQLGAPKKKKLFPDVPPE